MVLAEYKRFFSRNPALAFGIPLISSVVILSLIISPVIEARNASVDRKKRVRSTLKDDGEFGPFPFEERKIGQRVKGKRAVFKKGDIDYNE